MATVTPSFSSEKFSPSTQHLYRVEFVDLSTPFAVRLNYRECYFNALPFSVLYVIFGRVVRHGCRPWPKGHELAIKCDGFWQRIDSGRYRSSTREPEDRWAGWLNLTRRELALSAPHLDPYAVLPDGKKHRREGLAPRIADECEITGISDFADVWPTPASPRVTYRPQIESISSQG